MISRTVIARFLVAAIAVLLIPSCSSNDSPTQPDPERVFDFTLMDENPESPTYQQPVSISDYLGRPVVLYVGSAGCEFCVDQMVALADLETEWRAEGDSAVALGMNQIGQEAGVELMGGGRTIPVLQDTREADVMRAYGINYNDVIVLDAQGRVYKQVLTSQGDLNLVRTAGQDSVRGWLDDLAR